MSDNKYKIFILLIVLLILLIYKSYETNKNKLSNHVFENLNKHSSVREKNSFINNNIKISTSMLSEKDYNDLIVPLFKEYINQEGNECTIPPNNNFVYPIISGMNNENIQAKINSLLKQYTYNNSNTSPLRSVTIGTTPNSHVEYTGIIVNSKIISIPILIIYDYDHQFIYKSGSLTFDLESGDRLYLDNIIELDNKFSKDFLYNEKIYVDIELVSGFHSEYISNYYKIDKASIENSVERLISDLSESQEEDKNKTISNFYLTNNSIILTEFSNRGVPMDIEIPISNIKKFLKIDLIDFD